MNTEGQLDGWFDPGINVSFTMQAPVVDTQSYL